MKLTVCDFGPREVLSGTGFKVKSCSFLSIGIFNYLSTLKTPDTLFYCIPNVDFFIFYPAINRVHVLCFLQLNFLPICE